MLLLHAGYRSKPSSSSLGLTLRGEKKSSYFQKRVRTAKREGGDNCDGEHLDAELSRVVRSK